MNSVTILGYGWLGKELTKYLKSINFSVKITKRNLENFKEDVIAYPWSLGKDFPKEAVSDIVIIAIAEQENIIENYIKLYLQLENFGVKKIIFISSSSIYNDVIGEASETSEIININATVALKEQSLKSTNIPSAVLRLSGLVGPNRNPAKFLAGKNNVANPMQKVNLVHQQDVIRFIEKCIVNNATGIYNVCSSTHPTREEFYTKVCMHFNMEAPVFAELSEPSRYVSNEKSKNDFDFNYEYDDLLEYYLRSEAKA